MNVQTIVESGALGLAQAVGIDRWLTLQLAGGGMVTDQPARNFALARPDSLSPEVAASAKAMTARMDAIRNAPFPDDTGLPRLTRKQIDRIAAFALRDETRRDR